MGVAVGLIFVPEGLVSSECALFAAFAKKNVKTLAQRNKHTIFAVANGQ